MYHHSSRAEKFKSRRPAQVAAGPAYTPGYERNHGSTCKAGRSRQGEIYTYFLGRMIETIPLPATTVPELPPGQPGLPEGHLLIIGMVAGRAPRTMEVQLRAIDQSEPVILKIRPWTSPNGAFGGLQISRADPAQEAERIGLKIGDVITTVNGVRLKSLFQTIGTVRKAFKESSVNVELARGGETFARTLDRHL